MRHAWASVAALLCLVVCAKAQDVVFPVDFAEISADPAARSGFDEKDFGSCDCDLTRDKCDLNCCCDSDCSGSMKQFSICSESFPITNVPLCLDDDEFVKVNKKTLTNSPLCVVRENSPLLGEFIENPGDSFTEEDVKVEVEKSSSNALLLDTLPTTSEATTFSVGDFIRAGIPGSNIVAGSMRGLFSVNRPDSAGVCRPSPARYFHSQEREVCTPPAVLNSGTFQSKCTEANVGVQSLLNVVVADRPSALFSDSNSFISVGLKEITRGTNATAVSSNTALNAVSFNSNTSSCMNFPTRFEYRVVHNAEGETESVISKVHAYVWLSDITSEADMKTEFGISFHKSDASAAGIDKNRLSGRPGYQVGKLLRSGTRSTSGNKEGVLRNEMGFTIPVIANAQGQCLNSPSATELGRGVVFGGDIVVGCTMSLTAAQFDSFCSGLTSSTTKKPAIISFMETAAGVPIEHMIGEWGDSNSTNIKDWVAAKLDAHTSYSPTLTNNKVCTGVPDTLVMEIMHTPLGHFTNPQSKIIAVRVYYRTSDWSRPATSSTGVFPLSVTVTFVEKAPVGVSTLKAGPPPVVPPLPDDIFFPFGTTSPSTRPTTLFGAAPLVAAVLTIVALFLC